MAVSGSVACVAGVGIACGITAMLALVTAILGLVGALVDAGVVRDVGVRAGVRLLLRTAGRRPGFVWMLVLLPCGRRPVPVRRIVLLLLPAPVRGSFSARSFPFGGSFCFGVAGGSSSAEAADVAAGSSFAEAAACSLLAAACDSFSAALARLGPPRPRIIPQMSTGKRRRTESPLFDPHTRPNARPEIRSRVARVMNDSRETRAIAHTCQ